jgi:hypothetical protein
MKVLSLVAYIFMKQERQQQKLGIIGVIKK